MDLYTETPLYEVNIDFDEASREWRANKKHIGNCHYLYVCGTICKNGNPCQNTVQNGDLCHIHNKRLATQKRGQKRKKNSTV